jgi:hypothetical protein
MALPVMLLDERKMAITVVPLKLLQHNHVCALTLTILVDGWYVPDCLCKLEAFDKYGISSFVLNEDSPYDDEIWKVCLVTI